MKRCVSSPGVKIFVGIMLCLCMLSGCGGAPAPGDAGAVRQFFAMDTVMQVTVYGERREEAASAAEQEVNRLERILSRVRTGSPVSRMNTRAGDGTAVPLAPEALEVLSLSRELYRQTDGMFDVTVAPVMDAWGFGLASSAGTAEDREQGYRVPSREELQTLLTLVDSDGLLIDTDAAAGRLVNAGMAVDLGGIAKGYAAGKLIDLLKSYQIESALLDLGGNITGIGTRYDGQPWRIAIQDPKSSSDYLCVLSLADVTASTSGGYERYFERDGQRYHHILDPRTGYPARHGMLSATVISSDAARNDALSTALFVMGPEGAVAFWREHGDFEFVLAREDGTVLISEGLEDNLEFWGEKNGYTCEIVRR